MDRCLQSALDKRTRVGTWQTRVYRLERGYLSTWPDVTSAAAKEDPSGTECLFQGKEVAILTDLGDRRFKLEFPWDSSSNLSLRANDVVMKKSWVDVLRATLKEAASQIEGTGSVFAYGGISHHREDESYEEATYLKTNRFLAAHVVDASSRASYVNDCLNEYFQQGSVAERGEGTVVDVCAGADAVIDEQMALMQDFKDEMLGLEDLRQVRQGSGLGDVGPAAASPKIRRFCEDYLMLWGRLMTNRLMLELAPFMDSAMAGTQTSPDSARAVLVSSREKLDQMYTAAERILVAGSRRWLFDIRGRFLDREGLLSDSNPHRVAKETLETDPVPTASPSFAVSASSAATRATEALRSSSKSLFARALSAPRVDGTLSSSAESQVDPGGGAAEPTSGGVAASLGSQLTGFFRRASRTEQNQNGKSPPNQSPGASPYSGGGNNLQERISPREDREQRSQFSFGDRDIRDANAEAEAELFAGAKPSTQGSSQLSPRVKVGGEPSGAAPGGTEEVLESSPALPTSPNPEGGTVRRGRRAFAGGFWSGGGLKGGTPAEASSGARPTSSPVTAPGQTRDFVAPVDEAPAAAENTPSGGKRQFAGGAMRTEVRLPRSAHADSNPFGDDGHREGFDKSNNRLHQSDLPRLDTLAVEGENRSTTAPVPHLREPQDVVSPVSGAPAGVAISPSGGSKRWFAGGAMGLEVRAPMMSHDKSSPFGGRRVDSGKGASPSPRPRASGWETSTVASESASPAWASGNATVPNWARDEEAGTAAGSASSSQAGVGEGLAPPSRPDAASEVIARRGALMGPEKGIPESRPRQLRRPGGGGRRAFGGGQSVF